MAVDSNKVGAPNGNWGITNRKLIASCFFFKNNKQKNKIENNI